MSGGLMQLVAYGAQDVYLTGNPQITFFKTVYRRHTNFAIEAIEQNFNGNADFGKKVSAIINRNGDLIHRVYLNTILPQTQAGISGRWTDDVGEHLIDEVEIQIGGQMIDRQFGDWLHIWAALTVPHSMRPAYNKMIGHDLTLCTNNAESKPATELHVPLQFWFCRKAGLALPLIAMQYHNVKIDMRFKSFEQLWINTDRQEHPRLSLGQTCLFIDYVYLDTKERRRFAQVSHEYLIEQVQFTGAESLSNMSHKIRTSFNHPTKELIWVAQKESHTDIPNADNNFIGNQWSNYQTKAFDVIDTPFTPFCAELYGGVGGNMSCTHGITSNYGNPIVSSKIQLNGQDRFSTRSGRYFNLVQPWQHHTATPNSEGINVYSFALNPEEHQPSGSLNMSRIDNASLHVTMHPDSYTDEATGNTVSSKLRIYAVNYNVLRVASGMAGLAYSN